MAQQSNADKITWFYVTTPLDGKTRKFALKNIEGEEQISGLFFYKLSLTVNDDTSVDFTKLMGQTVTVCMMHKNETDIRYVNGVVTRFIQGEFDGYTVTYYAEIRPWLWQLTLCSNNKIFQNKKVTEIITSVFSDRGFRDVKDNTKGSYEPREFCVQYGETDFDFISRLMEDDGIFYFFEHTKDKHTLILGDDASAHQNCPGLKSARLRNDEPISDDLVEYCTFEQELVSNKYIAKDFNFETPDTSVFTTVNAKETGKLSVYEYPGGFSKADKGEKIANKRIEAIEVPAKVLKGRTYCLGFTPGYKFKFTDHYRKDIDGTYVIRQLKTDSSEARYENTFEAFPEKAPFRPPVVTKKPKIYGTQTAVVVGKSGEEIWTDKYGRVMVQFHWDQDGKKDEKSSCWVRVAQMWAGKNWGTLFIPRVGMEVIVSFLEGDPDQPVVIGTVYNATQTMPYAMPGNKNKTTIKTISTKKGETGENKGNELRFDDTKDAEEFFIHAQKDMNTIVEKNRTTTLKEEGNDSLTLDKGNRDVTLTEGNESLTLTKGNRDITLKQGNQTVKLDKGDETVEIKGKRTLTIDDKEDHTSKADFNHTVKGNFVLKVDGDLTLDVKGEVTIKSGKNITIKASQNLTSQAGQALTNKSGTDLTNKAGTGLTNKAGTNLTNNAGANLTNKAGANLDNKAGAMMTNKASAMETVDGGGMLTVKGGLVKIG
ncbi:MAG: type VI secretion system tip protein VgrG [Desulfobacterales bacterium]|nr:type VI secretion system tip protein VgrG [Desulfobacterales bacterium]